MSSEKEKLWLEQIKLGRYKATENGEILNLISQKSLDKNNKAKNQAISFVVNKKQYVIRKMRAIWLYFHGEIAGNLRVSPIDGNPRNTTLYNLELITNSAVVLKAYARGTMRPPKSPLLLRKYHKGGRQKLTDAIVTNLRKAAKQNIDEKSFIADNCKKLAISKCSLQEAISGKTFKWLKEPGVKVCIPRVKSIKPLKVARKTVLAVANKTATNSVTLPAQTKMPTQPATNSLQKLSWSDQKRRDYLAKFGISCK